jgi:hypothetical protein
VLNGQLTFLGACFADKVMSSTIIKENTDGVSISGKHTHEDLFILRNILHSSVVHTAGPGSDNLLLAMRWMVDVAMNYVLLGCSALSDEVAHTTTIEVDVGGSFQ